MKVRILFDKKTKDKKLHVGWGVSFLVDNKILFDTGENGPWLMENMKYLNVAIDRIEAVVISHNHWDHTGGLWELLKSNKKLIVYACPHFGLDFKDRVKRLKGALVETKEAAQIAKDVFVTGEIGGKYKDEYMPEQALVVRTAKGITVITGCAHPGVVKILEKIKEQFANEQIYLVLGGFHLIDKDTRAVELIVDLFKKLGVEKAGPTHCAGSEAEAVFKSKYQRNFINMNVGGVIEV